MKKLYFLLFFFSLISLGQNAPLEIRIDSITSFDSIPNERNFIIDYHIENVTNHEIKFFLNPDRFSPTSASAMQFIPTYRLYQNNVGFDVSQVFTAPFKRKFGSYSNSIEAANEMKKFQDSIVLDIQKMNNDGEYAWKKKNKSLLDAVFTLKPNEIKHFTKKLTWNKMRYYKSQELEFYLDENATYSLEINYVLLKEEHKDWLTDEEFKVIANNKNFIRGWFSSNKVEINLKE